MSGGYLSGGYLSGGICPRILIYMCVYSSAHRPLPVKGTEQREYKILRNLSEWFDKNGFCPKPTNLRRRSCAPTLR